MSIVLVVGYMGGLSILGCSMDTKRRLFVQDPGNSHGSRAPKAFHFHGLLEQAQSRIRQTKSRTQRIGYVDVSLAFFLTSQCLTYMLYASRRRMVLSLRWRLFDDAGEGHCLFRFRTSKRSNKHTAACHASLNKTVQASLAKLYSL